ncbi:unnamed protein product [Protopolystoma xenopodis]|uniref:Uncharacterized protein n=1 Tax=Protopolystoma xenopodis TaxID=117903 RepID=A0A448WCM5_9PLAT|nr:unnamed protein product [Protopolystoma xenopodis]
MSTRQLVLVPNGHSFLQSLSHLAPRSLGPSDPHCLRPPDPQTLSPSAFMPCERVCFTPIECCLHDPTVCLCFDERKGTKQPRAFTPGRQCEPAANLLFCRTDTRGTVPDERNLGPDLGTPSSRSASLHSPDPQIIALLRPSPFQSRPSSSRTQPSYLY